MAMKSRIKQVLAVAVSAACMMASVSGIPALADSTKVITIGADLSDEEKSQIIEYFGIGDENVETLTITNTDEREHLQNYVPIEQIGTKTYSCAYVCPTTSDGIQVKTANLTWVTSNMIAATLSTSGVVNCDVIAAAPFPVSGTGALTGVIMAYETASGETLDEDKKDAANMELVTTATLGDSIGQDEATLVVNEAKDQIIEGEVEEAEEIEEIVDEITDDLGVTLTDEDRELLTDLLNKISELDYDYEDVKDTLDRVESNAADGIDIEINIENDNSSDNSSDNENGNDNSSDNENTNSDDISVDDDDYDDEFVIAEETESVSWIEKLLNSDSSDSESSTVDDDSILNSTNDDVFGSDAVIDTTYDDDSYNISTFSVNNNAASNDSSNSNSNDNSSYNYNENQDSDDVDVTDDNNEYAVSYEDGSMSAESYVEDSDTDDAENDGNDGCGSFWKTYGTGYSEEIKMIPMLMIQTMKPML